MLRTWLSQLGYCYLSLAVILYSSSDEVEWREGQKGGLFLVAGSIALAAILALRMSAIST